MYIDSAQLPRFEIHNDKADDQIDYTYIYGSKGRFGVLGQTPIEHLKSWLVGQDYDDEDGLSRYTIQCNSDVCYDVMDYINSYQKAEK